MIIRFFFIVCFIFNICFAEYKYELSMCTIFRNEASYLKEWIEFHQLVGFQHFYLCSHNSTDHYKEVLKPYIDKGIVELFEIATKENEDNLGFFNAHVQCKFFTDCLNYSRGSSKWVAFLDTDEFLFPVENVSLLDLLKEYDDCVGIGVNWQMFGTSWVEKITENDLLIELLTRCARYDYSTCIHIKSLVRPEYAIRFINPHFPLYHKGFSQVNTDRVPIMGAHSPYIQVNKLRINHYWLRDEYYFQNYKIPRRLKWGDKIENLMQSHRDLNEEENTLILRYVPELRQKMNVEIYK